MSRLLALDQSSHITGYAVFENAKLVHYGKFSVDDDDVGERLVKIRNNVQGLIDKYVIDELVFEDIQMQANVQNNVDTFKKLAEVFGVIYELATELEIPNTAVLASSWKSTLKVRGKNRPEQKRNAQAVVEKVFEIKPTQDECDAICIGLHHILKPNHKANEVYDWSD